MAPSPAAKALPIAFTVDVEDWYHGIEIPTSQWADKARRLRHGLDVILQLCADHGVQGTFFILGKVAEEHPGAVKAIADAGHELGSHGLTHTKVYDLTPQAFAQELRTTRQLVEDLTGQAVTSHRSPYFSITARSLWALDALAEAGFTTDCSISPIVTWRYGIAGTPDVPYTIGPSRLVEFPLSSVQVFGKALAVGGAYFRLLPYRITAKGLARRQQAGLPSMFYIHPWEYDPQHPRLPLERKARFTHYTNLQTTAPRTARLFRQFRFAPITQVLQAYQAANPKPLPHRERLG